MKKLMLIGAVALAMAGCTTPYLNKHFGETKQAAQRQQLANPRAPVDQPDATVEGQVSNAAMDRYHNAYGKPEAPADVFKIGVGTK
ncbi:MAG: hypothetical protein K0S46_1130 [Moraxellaceae bacterium]|jgi:hypothetical protein|nr:hypothetical protein [Moraxellaceae bacterium]